MTQSHGKIIKAERQKVQGVSGFLLTFTGKEHAMEFEHHEYTWISTSLAYNLGLIKDKQLIPALYEELFVGKHIELIFK